LKADQPFEVAEKMKWLVAALYSFSAIVMFISIAFIYNLNKKKVAQMTADLNARRAAVAGTVVASETTEAVVEEAHETVEEAVEEVVEEIEE